MRNALRHAVISALLVFTLRAVAVEPSIEVTVSDRFVEAGEPFQLFVKIEGEPRTDFVEPKIEGMRLRRERTGIWLHGPQTINYRCVAEKAGKVTIPPFTATVDGVKVSSEPIEITVRGAEPGDRRKRSSPGSSEPIDKNLLQARQPTVDDITFLRASVDKLEVYEGEGIQFELGWWHLEHRSVDVAASAPPAEPLFENFYTVDQEDYRTEENSGGFRYEVFHYRRLLYPTRSGELTIPSSEVRADIIMMVNFRVDTQPVQLKTDPITIHVKPLPPRPKNFSGAVGQFTFEVAPSETVHVQGVPFFLVAKVTGTGNPDAIGEPIMPGIDWAQVGAPHKSVQQLQHGIEKKFTYAVTPLDTGSHTIAPIAFTYFDPLREEYVTLTAGPFDMPVADSPESQHHMIHSADIGRDIDRVSVLSEGILPLDSLPGGLRPQRLSPVAFSFAAIVPPVGYVAVALFLERRRRFAADTAYARAYRAGHRAHDALARAVNAAEPVEALYRAATGYLADIRNLPPGSITYADAQEIIVQLNVDPVAAGPLLKVIRACERHRYAGAGLSNHEVSALVEAAEDAIDEVDALLRKERA